MRGQWESQTRRLNRHYQSADKAENLVLYDFPADKPFMCAEGYNVSGQVVFCNGGVIHAQRAQWADPKSVLPLTLKQRKYRLRFEIHPITERFGSINYVMTGVPLPFDPYINVLPANQVYYAGGPELFDTTESSTSPRYPKGFSWDEAFWDSGNELAYGNDILPIRVKHMEPSEIVVQRIGIKGRGLSVFTDEDISYGKPIIVDFTGIPKDTLSKYWVLRVSHSFNRFPMFGQWRPVECFWGKCWLEPTDEIPFYDQIIVPWSYS